MYGSLFRNVLWPLWETGLHSRKTPAYLAELERSQWMPPQEIRARQDDRRREITAYAVRESPFHRDRFRALGIDPSACLDPDVWQRIPLMTKSDLQKHKDAILADSWRGRPLIWAHSGGSTGNPVEFCFNRDHYDRRIAGWYRADRWGGWDLGEKHIMFWLGVGSGVGARDPREVRKESWHWRLLRWKTLTTTQMGPDRMREYHRVISRWRPRSMFGYTNPMYVFSKFLIQEGLEMPAMRGAIVSGEKAFPWQKQMIREAFKAPVFERYGCQEFCNIAAECDQHNGMHVNADALYVEITDDQGVPLPAGQTGQVVVTSFDNLAMPFLRYKMGDLGSLLADPCPCGRGLPRLKEIAGREMDMIVTPEGSICAGIMMPHFMKEFSHIQGFQFVQESVEHLRLRIVPDAGFDRGILGFMEEQLRRYVGPTMRVDFEFVDSLETLRSGKYKMVISKVRA